MVVTVVLPLLFLGWGEASFVLPLWVGGYGVLFGLVGLEQGDG